MNKQFQTAVLAGLFVLCATSSAGAITYDYDNQHRLARGTYDDGSAISYDYDAVGSRTMQVINTLPNTVYLTLHVAPPKSGQAMRNPDITRCAACTPALAIGMSQKETTAPQWIIRT